MTVDVTQVAGFGGYLFASTDATGVIRYAGLYSGTTRMTLYYYTLAGNRKAVRFITTIADGQRHTVSLSIRGAIATLLVDSSVTLTEQLALDGGASMVVCGSLDICSFMLGARADVTGSAFALSGVLHRVVLITNKGIPLHLSTNFTTRSTFPHPQPAAIDWFEGENRTLFLTGSRGFTVTSHDYSAASSFSIAMVIRAVPDDSGYMFSKATAAGSRFYSLYVSSTRRAVSLYYLSGSSGLTRLDWNVDLSDGGIYHVLLVVEGITVRLYVDDIQIGDRQTLGAPIQDCGARTADCLLTIGERPSPGGGAHRLAGLFYDAQFVNGQAISAYPFYAQRPLT